MPYQERERGRNLELFCFVSLFCCSFKKLFIFSWRVIALQRRVGFCHKSARISHGGGGLVTQSCLTLATPWTVACQAPLSMGIVQAGYWVGCHLPLQGIFRPRNQTWVSCVAGRFFTNWGTREAFWLSGFLKGMHPDFHGLDCRSLILYTLFPLSQFLEHKPVWKGLIHSTMLQSPLVPINPVALSVHKCFPP